MARLRFALLPLLLLAAVPASASAGFDEAPALLVESRGEFWQSSGRPGEVVVGSATGVRVLRATRAGFEPAGEVQMGEGFSPGELVSDPSGAAVLAGTANFDDSVVAALREPGGAWSAPLPVAERQGWEPMSVTADVSARGDVVVAWVESRFRPEPRIRVRVARRAAGEAAFGPASVLLDGQRQELPPDFEVGISDTGEAIASWTTLDASAKGSVRLALTVAVAPPGADFGAPRELADVDPNTSSAVDVGGDGRVLVSYVRDGFVHFSERAPGGEFAPGTRLASASDPAGVKTMARLGAGGAAAIAWSGNLRANVRLATRPGYGGFRAPVTLVPQQPLPAGFDPFFLHPEVFGYTFSFNAALAGSRLVLTGDGRALLGLSEPRTGGGVEFTTARLAAQPLVGGGAVGGGSAGNQLDTPFGAEPMLLEDGSPALIWATAIDETKWRLHLATEGASRPAAGPAPSVRVGAPVKTTLKTSDALRLPVRCGGPCTVRAQVVGGYAEGSVTLDRAGEARLPILPLDRAIAPRREGVVRVRLTYGTPDSLTPEGRTISVRLKRAAEKLPRIVGLRAKRERSGIKVSFRVVNPPRLTMFYVSGSKTRDDRGRPLVITPTFSERPSQKTFRATLQVTEGVRYVTVRSYDGAPLRVTVKVS